MVTLIYEIVPEPQADVINKSLVCIDDHILDQLDIAVSKNSGEVVNFKHITYVNTPHPVTNNDLSWYIATGYSIIDIEAFAELFQECLNLEEKLTLPNLENELF